MIRRLIAMNLLWSGLLMAQPRPTTEELLGEFVAAFDHHRQAEILVSHFQDDYANAQRMYGRWDSLSQQEKRWTADVYERYAAATSERIKAARRMLEIRQKIRLLAEVSR